MKKGDLIKNKNDGEIAIILRTWVKFFPDHNHCAEFDSGVADTAVRIKWMNGGQEHVLRRGRMKRNWEVISD